MSAGVKKRPTFVKKKKGLHLFCGLLCAKKAYFCFLTFSFFAFSVNFETFWALLGYFWRLGWDPKSFCGCTHID